MRTRSPIWQQRIFCSASSTMRVCPSRVIVGAAHSTYLGTYETVHEEEGANVKLVNAGKQFILHEIRGFLQSRIVFFLMNLHIRPRYIYLSRVRRHVPSFVYLLFTPRL